jgi:broad specificity phosphatase PhoE
VDILFIRHAQSMGNLTLDYSTGLHDTLSTLGQEQADRVIETLTDLAPGKIYTSPLGRALGTILPFLRASGRSAEVWPELCEGCWQYDLEAPASPEPRWAEPVRLPTHCNGCLRFREDDVARRYAPEDETYADGVRRVEWCRSRLLAETAGKPGAALVVGHGCHGARLLERLLDWEPKGRFVFDNTEICRLAETAPGRYVLATSHRMVVDEDP